ncbi:terpene synthase family protein [Streptomyces ochraceiscleroticus]|uniref:Terpene synthase n=1 Tax=Streptomyces ochraceiscleroticus TaxID=47761 RepID=A0ABW1MV87_9ACTN|nr:terpene synthase family protein [Streptomyces ochraceiscleroticus]
MAMTVNEIDLPPIFCPLESARHPRAHIVDERAKEWIRTSPMCATAEERTWVTASCSTDFFARFAPDAATDDRLLWTSLWVYWGFAFDDHRCDNGPFSTRPADFSALAGRVQRALEAPSARDESDGFIPALQEIAAQFRSFGTPLQVRRFAAAHRAWLSGVTWQIGNAAAGRMPGLDEYVAMRLLSAGGEPPFAMLELATGLEVPAQDMERPAVRALTEMAIMVAALDNDRHSLRKELARDQTDQNVYSVLMHETGAPLPEAAATATRLRDRVLLRFMAVHDRVRPGAGLELSTYLQGLRYGIRGNAEWGLRVPRYLSLGRVPDPMDEAPLEWAESPADDDRSAPRGLPTVAWWWDDALLGV